jgi:hypothetical protein
MNHKAIILAATLAGLSGCTDVAVVPTPSGGTGIRVACNQLANCYRRAAEECGPKWRIIDASNAMKPTPQIIVVCGSAESKEPKA